MPLGLHPTGDIVKRFILLLLAIPCVAQIQGNAPGLFYSQPGNLVAEPDYQLHLHQNVSVGDCVVVSSEFQDIFGRGHSNYPVTDSLGNSYTNLATVNSGSNYIYTSYSNITVAGTDVLFSSIPSVSSFDQVYAWGATIYRGITCTSNDGTASSTPSSGTAFTATAPITTTANGDIIVATTTGGIGDNNTQYAFANSNGAHGQSVKQTFLVGGQSGSAYSPGLQGYNGTLIMQTVAFKPNAIRVNDTVMPDGGNTIAYSASLHGSGGAGAYTYACSGLPGWASLNTATGAITGTATTGTTAFTCTVTDGTLTSANADLSIRVGATLDTPALNQSAIGALLPLGGNPGAAFSSSVNCGDVIEGAFTGQDSHAALGWVSPGSSAFDSLSTTYNRIGPTTGAFQPPFAHYIGAVTGSGANTFNVSDISGTALNFIANAIRGSQAAVDVGVAVAPALQPTSPITYTVNCTTLVPNTLCVFDTSTANPGDTITYSPLTASTTSSSSYNTVATGAVLVASPSTYTATVTVTTSAPFSSLPVTTAYQFRPAIVPACSGIPGRNEKFRRVAW